MLMFVLTLRYTGVQQRLRSVPQNAWQSVRDRRICSRFTGCGSLHVYCLPSPSCPQHLLIDFNQHHIRRDLLPYTEENSSYSGALSSPGRLPLLCADTQQPSHLVVTSGHVGGVMNLSSPCRKRFFSSVEERRQESVTLIITASSWAGEATLSQTITNIDKSCLSRCLSDESPSFSSPRKAPRRAGSYGTVMASMPSCVSVALWKCWCYPYLKICCRLGLCCSGFFLAWRCFCKLLHPPVEVDIFFPFLLLEGTAGSYRRPAPLRDGPWFITRSITVALGSSQTSGLLLCPLNASILLT